MKTDPIHLKVVTDLVPSDNLVAYLQSMGWTPPDGSVSDGKRIVVRQDDERVHLWCDGKRLGEWTYDVHGTVGMNAAVEAAHAVAVACGALFDDRG